MTQEKFWAKSKLGLKKGDVLICPEGHIVLECIEDVKPDDVGWGHKLTGWLDQEVPESGAPASKCLCKICGSNWFSGRPAKKEEEQ